MAVSLEDYVAHINGIAFWKEFTFAKNKFSPQPGRELELADNFVWLGSHAFVLQLKERQSATDDPVVESTWFRKKVLDKATSQVRDTLRYLEQNAIIRITNERGHDFEIITDKIISLTKLVVFFGGPHLPEECLQTRFYISRTAGFIHIIAAHDYLGIIEKLRVPEDIRRYFEYRESIFRNNDYNIPDVDESDIMGGFLSENPLPNNKSKLILYSFLQDAEKFDISSLIGNLHAHIQHSNHPQDYYKIMMQFANVPRSVWREVKLRFMRAVDAVKKQIFTRPFLLAFPASDCAFMIAPLDPELPATGAEGEKTRLIGLRNLTDAAMYRTRVGKGIGILISKDGNFFQIDWAFIELPWCKNEAMDAVIARMDPFRSVDNRFADSFLFRKIE